MRSAELVVLVTAAACIALTARRSWRDPASIAMFTLLGAGALFCTWRDRPAPEPSPSERFAGAVRANNPYEALFAARLWSEQSPEGTLAYARACRAFGLYRTCEEQADRLSGEASEVVRRRAHSLAIECAERHAAGAR